MIQTCLSILTRALAGVGVYKIQKCKDKKSQTTQNSLPSLQDEQSFSKPYSAEGSKPLLNVVRFERCSKGTVI